MWPVVFVQVEDILDANCHSLCKGEKADSVLACGLVGSAPCKLLVKKLTIPPPLHFSSGVGFSFNMCNQKKKYKLKCKNCHTHDNSACSNMLKEEGTHLKQERACAERLTALGGSLHSETSRVPQGSSGTIHDFVHIFNTPRLRLL